MHTHRYVNTTSCEQDHKHSYKGATSYNPDTPGHRHCMAGYTSLDDGHIHRYTFWTDPAIYVDGQHYHNYCAVTSVDQCHNHIMDGAVSAYSEKNKCCCYPV